MRKQAVAALFLSATGTMPLGVLEGQDRSTRHSNIDKVVIPIDGIQYRGIVVFNDKGGLYKQAELISTYLTYRAE